MTFVEFVRELFGFKRIDAKTEAFMDRAERIKPEGPLNYKNDVEDLGITREGADL